MGDRPFSAHQRPVGIEVIVHHLVNNVGGSTYARFLDITDEDFRLVFDWCVTSAFIMSQLVAPHMIHAGHGSIVNISSGSARFGIRALTAYCVVKGALEAPSPGT